MIADLFKKNVKIKQFADDLSLLGKIEIPNANIPNRPKVIGIDQIQEYIHEVAKWLKYKGFKLSAT